MQQLFQIYHIYYFMKQFNTFAANSPMLSDYYTPKGSQKFAFPSNSNSRQNMTKNMGIDPLKMGGLGLNDNFNKPSIQKLNNEHEQNQSNQQQLDGLQSNLSLLMSTVSVPAAHKPQIDSKKIFTLENNITQQILELRQQKITYMQQLSKILDTKNLYEHYILKVSREKEDIETDLGTPMSQKSSKSSKSSKSYKSPRQAEDEIAPLHVSAPILKRNEQLHLRLKELEIKEEIFGPNYQEKEEDRDKNQRLLEQIMQVRQLNSNLRGEISTRLKNVPESPNHQSRFVTFLPQDRQKHFEQKPNNNYQQYKELQEKYLRLVTLNKQPHFRMTVQESQYIQALKRENRQLLSQVQQFLNKKKGNNPDVINDLQRKIDENERQKQIFLGELQRFKETMRKSKEQNENLKYQLSH